MNNRAIQNLTQQLQKSLDSNYDVVDMQTVLYVIQQLENTTITKEQLETTRLAKYINELRRRTSSEPLARRAKSLLKKWRDIFMPAIQQSTPISSNPGARNDTPPGPPCPSPGPKQQQQTTVPNSFLTHTTSNNKASTGSANSNSKTNIVSNGGLNQHQHQSLPMESKLDMLRPRGTRIVSPMMCPASSNMSIGLDRKQNYPSPAAAVQPTSFANVLGTAQSLKLGTSSNPSTFSHFRSDSPLPHITTNLLHPRRTRSPASILDFDSNSSRPQTAAGRSKTFVNGEHSSAMVASGVAVDLHDSNSVALDIAGAGAGSAVEEHPPGQLLRKMYSTQPASIATADVCSSSSSHRKSKKHKKEKKRNKQSPDKPPPTSEIALQASQPKLTNIGQSSVPFLNPYGGEIQPAGDEETHNTAGTGTVFPHHDSLSSSSMSRFPSNISTNTMTMQHNLRTQANNDTGPDHMEIREESDLTFAGKFKSSCSASAMVPDNTTTPVVKKSYSDSKDSSDVVVVESRSCSPFTTMPMGVDDSCSSSSRATITNETINLNADSNHDTPIEVKSGLSQPLTAQQDPGLSCNNIQMSAPAGATTMAVTEQLPVITPAPKKRGRKKGSRGVDAVIAQTHAFLSASMFERPRLLLGSKKVKTTKELLADIQNRKLGSSATSSPTLNSRQSVSPSTCSEASFQSDLTSTRASMPNPRLSPELLGAISNCRPSDIDDATSATESNDAGTLTKLLTTSSVAQQANKAVTPLSSVDEYLNSLVKQLPVVDRAKLELFSDETVACSCTVRETEPVAPITKQETIAETDNPDDVRIKDVPFDVGKSWPKPSLQKDTPTPVSNGSALESMSTPAQIPKKSPKKPIKSIFDLDYDEENDPLQSIVEAAKQRVNEKGAEEKNLTYQNDSKKFGDAILNKANQLTGESELSLAASTSNQGLTTDNLLTVSIPKPAAVSNGEFFDNTLISEVNAVSLPIYEAVEDINCPAKHRYEVQTNCITEHHINVLHNCFVPNVNGNWSGSIALTLDHSKQLRKHWSDFKQKHLKEGGNSIWGNSFSKISWWINDNDFLKTLHSENDPSVDEHLFDRVVPQYDHIIMDKIIKNLSHVKFTKNYMKKKLKRLKIEEEKEPMRKISQTERDADKSLNNASENRKVKKRKRTRTISSNNELNEDATSDKKHRHQRRRKHRKIRDIALESYTHVDISLSRIDVKDVVDQIDDMTSTSIDCEMKDEAAVFSREGANLSDTENTLCADISQQTDKLPQLSELKDIPESSYVGRMTGFSNSNLDFNVHHHTNYQSTSTVHSRSELKTPDQDHIYRHNCEVVNKTDEHIREPNAVNTELIESFAYISDKTSDVNNSSDTIKDNQLLPTVVTPVLNEYEGSNSRDYSCNSAESTDHYGNEDVDEEYGDEDYFEDDHANDEEHEVVTHDMTSSTSTTSQQHIVLTIKKKIPKSASSHVQVDGNNDILVSPRESTIKSEQDGEQLSIVTSSSTPTTITIRRKNKQQKNKQPNLGQQVRSPKDHFSDNEISDINANNNVKNGNPTTASGNSEAKVDINATAFSADETRTVNDLLLLEEDNLRVSHCEAGSSVESPHESISVSCKRNRKNLFQEDVSMSLEQSSESLSSSSPKTETLKSENIPETQLREAETNNGIDQVSVENNAQQCDDHDLSDNDDEKSHLPKENNGLLESFNELSEEHLCGLRVLHKPTKRKEEGTSLGTLSSSGNSSADVQDSNHVVQEFKEWHEVLQVPSYNDEILTILPYVVID